MCGIYGMAKSPRPLSKQQLKNARSILTSLAISSESRGRHSSGIAEIGKGNSLVHKSLSPSSEFIKTTQFKNALRRMNDISIYIGHTRFATMGEKSLDNALPFHIGNTIGAHNGCLYNTDQLEKVVGKACEVDTQYLFELVNREPSIDKVVDHIDGDFAISFVKDNTHTLYLAREKNRPCYLAYWSDARVLFYASEAGFLEKAFASANLEVEYYQINTNTLYAFDTRKFQSHATNVVKTSFEYKSREYQVYSNYYDINSYSSDEDYGVNVYDVDIEFGFLNQDVPDDGYIKPEEVIDLMSYGVENLESLYPIEDRTDSEYWELNPDTNEWYFLDPRDGSWYAESKLTPNRWCLVERLYDYEWFQGYNDHGQEEMEFDYAS